MFASNRSPERWRGSRQSGAPSARLRFTCASAAENRCPLHVRGTGRPRGACRGWLLPSAEHGAADGTRSTSRNGVAGGIEGWPVPALRLGAGGDGAGGWARAGRRLDDGAVRARGAGGRRVAGRRATGRGLRRAGRGRLAAGLGRRPSGGGAAGHAAELRPTAGAARGPAAQAGRAGRHAGRLAALLRRAGGPGGAGWRGRGGARDRRRCRQPPRAGDRRTRTRGGARVPSGRGRRRRPARGRLRLARAARPLHRLLRAAPSRQPAPQRALQRAALHPPLRSRHGRPRPLPRRPARPPRGRPRARRQPRRLRRPAGDLRRFARGPGPGDRLGRRRHRRVLSPHPGFGPDRARRRDGVCASATRRRTATHTTRSAAP